MAVGQNKATGKLDTERLSSLLDGELDEREAAQVLDALCCLAFVEFAVEQRGQPFSVQFARCFVLSDRHDVPPTSACL